MFVCFLELQLAVKQHSNYTFYIFYDERHQHRKINEVLSFLVEFGMQNFGKKVLALTLIQQHTH